MYLLVTSKHFERRSEKFKQAHPELKKRLAQLFRDLEADPFEPHLRLHPLKGKLDGLHAVSLTYEYRVVLTLKITEREIVLIDIGSHDEVYR
jgi:mRNA-degrading endonuclease YafQ of YafQ-DinJ toxin-antitoxin module